MAIIITEQPIDKDGLSEKSKPQSFKRQAGEQRAVDETGLEEYLKDVETRVDKIEPITTAPSHPTFKEQQETMEANRAAFESKEIVDEVKTAAIVTKIEEETTPTARLTKMVFGDTDEKNLAEEQEQILNQGASGASASEKL